MAIVEDLVSATTGNTLIWSERDPSQVVQKDYLVTKDTYRFDLCVDPAELNVYNGGVKIQSYITELTALVTAVQAQSAAAKAAAVDALDTLFT